MAEIEITSTSLVVHIRGVDQFFALESRLEEPWRISRAPGTVFAWAAHERARIDHRGPVSYSKGSGRPGDVRDPHKAIAIRLHDESYAKLMIGVDDPEATASAIQSAIGTP